MKLQLALDRLSLDECFRISRETESFVDWIEIGTGVIKEYGMSIVRDMRREFPEKTLVADMKTCDAAKHEAAQAFEAGADITTVMAFSADRSITDSLDVANQYGKRVMIDLLKVFDRQRTERLLQIGVDLVSLHIGKDVQQAGKFDASLFSLVEGLDFEVAVAGVLNLTTLPNVADKRPDVIIAGSVITKASDPGAAAAEMKGILEEYRKKD